MRALVLFGFMATSLAAQKVTIEFDESRDFSDYKTFSLVRGAIHSKNPNLNNELVKKKLDDIIRKRLTERGLTEVDSRPDLNITYTLGSGKRTQVERYGPGWRGGRRVFHYTEGTLVLMLRDSRKRELVWQAVAVSEKSDPAKVQGALDDMVRKSAEKYPPKKKS